MKSKNPVTLITGAILVVIFLMMVFTFQLRLTEVAVVTTFDNPKDFVVEPGLHFKWPTPIQKVYKFDSRTQNFDDRFTQHLTGDTQQILVMLYLGWRISDPRLFFASFPSGKPEEAEASLGGLVNGVKSDVVGGHPFSGFVSADPKAIEFTEIEKEMLDKIAPAAKSKYGIEVRFLGIKKIGLPASASQSAINRMQADREKEVAAIKGEGEASAAAIRSAADVASQELLTKANGIAQMTQAKAEATVAELLKVVNQEPELYRLIQQSRILPEALKGADTTLILDGTIYPWNLLSTQPSPTNSNGGGSK